MILSLPYPIWWVLFLLLASGVLMLSYWIVTKEQISFGRAVLVQLGLFALNWLLGFLIALMPLREILWLALAAVYFMYMLRLTFVRALLITLLQRVLYFLFVMAILAPATLPPPM